MVHALEAATAQRSNPFALAFARQALYLGGPGLGAVLDDPRDLEARGRMMMAACLAGLAIDQAGTGLAHAMGHALGNLAHLPHGAAVALAEAVVLPFNAAHEPRLHGLLFQDLGWPGAGAWTALLKRCSLDGSLIREALDPSRAGELAETCLAPENRPMVENNSRPVDRRQLDGLIRNLLEFLNSRPPRGQERRPMKITAIEIENYTLGLGPRHSGPPGTPGPGPDSRPPWSRSRTDQGLTGLGSGDMMVGFRGSRGPVHRARPLGHSTPLGDFGQP